MRLEVRKQTRRERNINRLMEVSLSEDGRQSAVTIPVLKMKPIRQWEYCAGHRSKVMLSEQSW